MAKGFSFSSRKQRLKSVSKFTATDKWRLTGVVVFLLAAAGLIRWLGSTKTPVPPFLNAADAQRSLPTTMDPRRFADPSIKEAYEIVSHIPHVLAPTTLLLRM